MKNKKGFTLVELIAVIVIIGLIAIITLPNVLKNTDAADKRALVIYASKAKDAADGVFANEFIREHASKIGWYSLSDLNMANEEYEGYVRIDRCSSEKNINVYIWDDEYKLFSNEVDENNVEALDGSPVDEINELRNSTTTCENLRSYNITYRYSIDGLTYISSPVSIRNGTRINLPTNIPSEATGIYGIYRLQGWRLGSAPIPADSTFTYTEDITLDAVLEDCGTGYTCGTEELVPINYSITYVNSCGTVYPENPTTYNIESDITLNNPSKTGYYFEGWYEGSNTPDRTYIIKNQRGRKVIYASCRPDTYSIAYVKGTGVASIKIKTGSDANYTSYTSSGSINANYGTNYTIETVCQNGYENPTAPTSGTISSNITYQASCSAAKYNITYTMNSGTNYSGAPTKYTYGVGATINGTPTRSGYTFNGWTLNLNAEPMLGFNVTIPATSTGNRTVIANWCHNCANVSNGSCTLDATTAGECTYTTSCSNGYTLTSGDGTYAPVCTAACSINVGQTYTFSYTGGVQTFTVPNGCDGLYKLEVWGGQGGTTSWGGSSAKGGYAIGYKQLTGNNKIYVVVGGGTIQASANYNGGGYAETYDYRDNFAKYSCGGGATHMATTNRGVLANYNSYRSEVLIVAGGAGVGTYYQINGGNGGGTTGGTGGNGGGTGGTQSSGYSFGIGQNGKVGSREDSYGYEHNEVGGSGGGGWYGGYAGNAGNSGGGGGGGSSYIGGVPAISYKGTTYSPSTTAGVQTGNGRAVITYLG